MSAAKSLSLLTAPPPHVLILTSLWHLAATFTYLVRPYRTLTTLFQQPPPHTAALDALRFLGGLNIGYALLAYLGYQRQGIRAEAALVLGVANLSQFFLDARLAWRGRWKKGGWGPTTGDLVFAILNLLGWWGEKMRLKREEEVKKRIQRIQEEEERKKTEKGRADVVENVEEEEDGPGRNSMIEVVEFEE